MILCTTMGWKFWAIQLKWNHKKKSDGTELEKTLFITRMGLSVILLASCDILLTSTVLAFSIHLNMMMINNFSRIVFHIHIVIYRKISQELKKTHYVKTSSIDRHWPGRSLVTKWSTSQSPARTKIRTVRRLKRRKEYWSVQESIQVRATPAGWWRA